MNTVRPTSEGSVRQTCSAPSWGTKTLGRNFAVQHSNFGWFVPAGRTPQIPLPTGERRSYPQATGEGHV